MQYGNNKQNRWLACPQKENLNINYRDNKTNNNGQKPSTSEHTSIICVFFEHFQKNITILDMISQIHHGSNFCKVGKSLSSTHWKIDIYSYTIP
jgi:hypothetical protein